MRNLAIVFICLTACATEGDQSDLGEFGGGKADVSELTIPIQVDPGKAMAFTLKVDRPFEMVVTYDEMLDVQLSADDGKVPTFLTGRQPVFLVKAPVAIKTSYKLGVTNKGSVTLHGMLTIRNPVDTCSDAIWGGWFDSLSSKLDGVGTQIDVDEQKVIDTLVLARPCVATSDVSYTKWLARFGRQLTASGSQIDPDEQRFITILTSVAPVATGDDAYLAWFTRFGTQLTASGSQIDPDENVFIKLLTSVAPVASGDRSYSAWLTRFKSQMSAVGSQIDPDEQVFVDLLVNFRPKTASDAAYVAWVPALKSFLSGAGSQTDPDERTLMMTVIRGKPCASGAAAQAAWNDLVSVTPSDASDVLAAAKPSAGCL